MPRGGVGGKGSRGGLSHLQNPSWPLRHKLVPLNGKSTVERRRAAGLPGRLPVLCPALALFLRASAPWPGPVRLDRSLRDVRFPQALRKRVAREGRESPRWVLASPELGGLQSVPNHTTSHLRIHTPGKPSRGKLQAERLCSDQRTLRPLERHRSRSFWLGHATTPQCSHAPGAAPSTAAPTRADMVFPPCSCSTGYINHSLSVFRIQDFEPHTQVPKMPPDLEIKECR